MPDEYRIELIKDNKDKEIEKLRKEIEYFKNRIPRLKIGFSNVNKDCIDHTDKDINAINILSEEDITKIIESEKLLWNIKGMNGLIIYMRKSFWPRYIEVFRRRDSKI